MIRVPQHVRAPGTLFIRSDVWSGTRRTVITPCTPRGSTFSESGSRQTRWSCRSHPENGIWIRPGFRAPTNYSLLSVHVDGNDDWVFFTSNAYRKGSGLSDHHAKVNATPFITYMGNGDISIGMPSNLVNRVTTEVLNKVSDMKVNIGTALAESGKTLSQLTRIALKIWAVLRKIRHGDFRGAAALLGMRGYQWRNAKYQSHRWSDMWLQIQYGLLPLLLDAFGIQEALKRGLREKDHIFHASRTISEEINPIEFSGDPSEYLSMVVGGSAGRLYQRKYFFQIFSSELDLFNNLGLTNPLAIAWEVVPFSFVVDWFLPIGNFLSALTAPIGVTFLAGYELRIQYADLLFQKSSGSCPGTEGKERRTTIKQFAMQRTKVHSLALPKLYFRNPLSSKHTASAIALIATRR